MGRRVVITGIGALSPIGIGKEEFWHSLKTGKNGIGSITYFDTSDYKAKLAAEIKDFNAEDFISKKEVRRMDRFSQFAMSAAQICVEDSGFDMDSLDEDERDRFAVMVTSGIGGLKTMEDNVESLVAGGNRKVSPFTIPMMIPNIAAGQIAMRYNVHGAAQAVVTACASSVDAIGHALRMIRDGYADRILAGGSEAPIIPLGVAAFTNMTALSTSENPDRASIPFDAERNGFIMGEGAGMFFLETLESAQERGAHIYAELVGYGCTCDAYHITAPNPEGIYAAKAMQMAMKEANVSAEEVDYINAHGTSTPANDVMETLAIKKALGESVARKTAISSTKSMMGHTLGAAGALEGIVCALAIENNFIPPTINLDVPDPECDLDYVAKVGRDKEINVALSNSFGFGGHNSCVCFKRI